MRQSTKKYRCVIIDDDFSSVNILREYISMIPKLDLINSYLNPVRAIQEIEAMADIDFLFLDVNMAISGLDIARLMRDKANFIILVTGHPEHALSAYNVQADKFLLKPVTFDKFLATINQVLVREMQ